MTIAEMHTYLDRLIDKANAPWFTPEEKDAFINDAIQEYVKNKYAKFETVEKVREDLLTLVLEFTDTNTNTIDLDSLSNFWFVLRLQVDIDSDCGELTGIPVTPMQHDDIAASQLDPFNKATDEYPQYEQIFTGGVRTIRILSDNVPTSLKMVYLAEPVSVDINTPTDSNLPEHTHREVLNIAVRMMFANLEDPGQYQIQLNEILNQE